MSEPQDSGGRSVPDLAAPLHTPTTRLSRVLAPHPFALWAKHEQTQMTGSAKERSAHRLLTSLLEDGTLRPGGTVVESTSGNLGVALARQCAIGGLTFVAVVDDRINPSTVGIIEAFGARVERVRVEPGADRLRARIDRAEEIVAATPGAVRVGQYERSANPRAHAEGTMPELVADLGRPPTHLYVAVSTCGTILGCQQAIAAHGWDTRVVAVDADGSALFGGTPGERRLPGLGAGQETAHSVRARPDALHRIDELDAVRGCRLLARKEGLLVGASTGAVLAAIAHDRASFGADDVVAMLVHDGGAPYLHTVFDDAWVRENLGGPRDGWSWESA